MINVLTLPCQYKTLLPYTIEPVYFTVLKLVFYHQNQYSIRYVTSPADNIFESSITMQKKFKQLKDKTS